jgi:TonB-dependent receptor
VLVQPYSTVANGSDAVSQGVEVYTQHTLSFGLGVQANFTYNDTSVTDISLDGQVIGSSPLVGSANTQVNGSIFYETDRLLLRASYNRRGEQVEGLQSGLNVYSEPYEQIDLNASVNLRSDLVVTASVINLTESEQRQHLGNDTDARFYSNVSSGRRAYLGLAYSF